MIFNPEYSDSKSDYNPNQSNIISLSEDYNNKVNTKLNSKI